jgi:hypothetical protein
MSLEPKIPRPVISAFLVSQLASARVFHIPTIGGLPHEAAYCLQRQFETPQHR